MYIKRKGNNNNNNSINPQNIFHVRNNITCSKICKYRTAASLCSTWFVSTICNCKYPHEGGGGDDDDDDDNNNNNNRLVVR